MSELAVKGCTVEITSGQSASNIQITTAPSSDNSVGDDGIYFGDIDVMLTSVTQGNLLCPSGTLTISGTQSDVLNSSDEKAVQKGDNGTKTITFTDQSTGATTDLPVTIEIKDAGQTDVIAL